MLLGDMNISSLMTHAQQVEVDKLRKHAKKTKKARTGNYEYSQQKSRSGNRSQFQQKSSTPAPSSSSIPSPRFRNDQKGRASGSKSQGSVTGTKTYPICPKCGKNHPGECFAGKERCFMCGQSGHRLRDCPSRQGQEGSGQRQNRLYALQARQDQEDSPDVVTGTLRVLYLDVYALLDPRATLSFVTPYIAVKFRVSLETLSEPFSVSTPVGDPVIARWPLPKTQLRKLAMSQPTDIPTVRKSVYGLWSVSVDQNPFYPASDVNDGRPTRTVIRSTVRRSDRSFTLSCMLSTFQVLTHTCATSSRDVGSSSQHPDHA
uniref:Gag-pol polyprotein n=1 Tax=Solanum tuberosum TaxID=4113 RepID=M1DXK3_SOLTU